MLLPDDRVLVEPGPSKTVAEVEMVVTAPLTPCRRSVGREAARASGGGTPGHQVAKDRPVTPGRDALRARDSVSLREIA
jgi:hypothetical protein